MECWMNSQNFKNKISKKNKFYLDQKLEYLRLIFFINIKIKKIKLNI